jgi:16S rRNA (uracil1498-N3)-methyltransferase
MHRFFLPLESFQPDAVVFSEYSSRQIAQVLRLKPETEVIVLDGSGDEFVVRLQEVNSKNSTGKVLSIQKASSEPSSQVKLYLCVTQREKYEWMLQKCTELGASSFVPVISSRSLVQSLNEVQSKYERWQKILTEAAEQSHRAKVPLLEPAVKFAQLAGMSPSKDVNRLIPWEDEKSTSIKEVLTHKKGPNVEILIGPEGGFSTLEVEQAQKAGFLSVSLGPRILRMETAAMTCTALVLYELGDMDARSHQPAQQ